MKPELREHLGKAVYEAENKDRLFYRWDSLQDPSEQERYRSYGEAAVKEFMGMIMPMVQNLQDIIVPTLTEEQLQQLAAAVSRVRDVVGE